MANGIPEIIGSGVGLMGLVGLVFWKFKGTFVSKDVCKVCREDSQTSLAEVKEDIKYVRSKVDELIKLHLTR